MKANEVRKYGLTNYKIVLVDTTFQEVDENYLSVRNTRL